MEENINQKLVEELNKDNLKFNEPLSKHTTFGIGGPAQLFFVAETTGELIKAIKLARSLRIHYFILGSGSNILFSDKGFKGLVIKNLTTSYHLLTAGIFAAAGVPLAKLVKVATENSFSGLEFAAGIPGTVGSAIAGNSGTKSGSISKVITKVKVLGKNNKIYDIDVKDCDFSYRSSRFKKSGEIVLSAILKLKKGHREEMKKKIKEVLRERKNQPWGRSAGSIFKNPKRKKAGHLIEECGLKGYRIGDAEISKKHANFIINNGKAKAHDVLELITFAKKKVKERFGIKLEEEIVEIGDFNG